MISVMKRVFYVKKLTESAFLRSDVKTSKLALDQVKYRIERITFFRFDYNIDPDSQDSRIVQDPLCFQFSLRMPQQHYDDTTNMVQDIISPANRAQISTKRATVMTYILGFVGANLFRTSVRNGTDSEIHGISSNSIGTPVPLVPQKMSILFNNKSNKVKFSYIGKLEFLDNQNSKMRC